MPFRSTAQQRFMFARHPQIAHRWADEMKGAHRKGARKHPIKSAGLPDHVDKSVMSILRKPKATGPIVRYGVTRASRVGIEIEHEGVKGWGVNESAARASWQQNRAMRDVGKSDSWEVPMDHFEPALPRRRPNYGAGNTVGKRMTGAVTGVAAPKKVQATRVAARRASAVKIPSVQPMTTKPPIPPNMVGKRDRSYNPEHNRQRRLGIASAVTAGGGGGAIASGVRDVRRDSGGHGREALQHLTRPGSEIRERNPMIGPLKERTQRGIDRGKATRPLGGWETRRISDEERKALSDLGHGARVTRRSGGKLALGAGLVGASGGMLHYARGRSNREWR